ncbi:MAG: sigma-70 family RNA polymerase sigma factor [Phycisphaerales bacterium]|nr:sigma-70 family RNA polymerase sigma factor [Phycisphaerales bacterium]
MDGEPEHGHLDAVSEPDPGLSSLLTAAGKGDEAAWRSIVDRYARRVYALARSRLGGVSGGSDASTLGPDRWGRGSDAAEEITQSVFVTVAGKLSSGQYTEQGRFESWLFRVAMNRIRDEARRRKRHAEVMDPEAMSGLRDTREAGVGSAGTGGGPGESIQALREAMASLSDSDREVIELRHHASLSFKQMADLLEEPLGTLLARHHRALKKLKDLLTGERSAAQMSEDHP